MGVRSVQASVRSTARAVLGLALLLPPGAALAASDAEGDRVIQQMRAAIEPDRPSVRTMNLIVEGVEGNRTFKLAQARKGGPGARRSLTVLLEPPDARGIAYLVAERKGEVDPVEYVYVPMVRRVRKLVGAENQTSFMDSDFTYADLGFLPLDAEVRVVGKEQVAGREVYKLESIPGSEIKKWYVSKMVTWVDTETLLPVQRDFYSPAGQVFKIETFREVARVDGLPTPFEIAMQNVAEKTQSVIKVTDVAYGKELPDQLFAPSELPRIADLIEKTGSLRPAPGATPAK